MTPTRQRVARLVAAIAVAASALAPVKAPPVSPELAKLRGEITSLKARLDTLHSAAATAEQRLAATDLQVQITLRELTLSQATLSQIAAQRGGLEQETRLLESKLSIEKKQIGDRLRQLYRLGGLSYFRVLMAVDKQQNPFEAISMLSYLVNRDARQIERFRTHEGELTALRDRLTQEQSRLAASLRDVAARQQAVAQARAEQQRLLDSLHLESRASEERLAQLEEKARRLERLMTLLYEQPQRAAAGGILHARGALPWPVRGAVTEEFGKRRSEKFFTYTVNNGIRIAAQPGTEAHAVFAGTVLYSQWFKGYGNLIIVDHGDRVFSLYGNTRIGLVHPGDKVVAGQPVATVNQGEAGEGGYLYFEIRENNRPVNPRNWLNP